MNNDDIPYNGFKNVIEMLHHADSNFRDRIIRNIAKKDPNLAKRLVEATRQSLSRNDRNTDKFTVPGGNYDDLSSLLESQDVLEKTQRSVRTRTYGR